MGPQLKCVQGMSKRINKQVKQDWGPGTQTVTRQPLLTPADCCRSVTQARCQQTSHFF